MRWKSKVDVGFVLDSSGSLKNYYHKEKEFLKMFAGGFAFHPDVARAGEFFLYEGPSKDFCKIGKISKK